MEKRETHAEIQYVNENNNLVHSDICPPGCDWNRIDDEYRQFIHECLDEWLNKSKGSGCFYISAVGYLAEIIGEDP